MSDPNSTFQPAGRLRKCPREAPLCSTAATTTGRSRQHTGTVEDEERGKKKKSKTTRHQEKMAEDVGLPVLFWPSTAPLARALPPLLAFFLNSYFFLFLLLLFFFFSFLLFFVVAANQTAGTESL